MTDRPKPPTDRGLVWAYVLDRRGGGRRIGWPEIPQWEPSQGLLWLHFDISETGPEEWIDERSGLDPSVASALLAEDTRPRSAPSRNGLLVILRGVNLNPGAEPDDMVSIRVWLEKDRIISTRRRLLLTSKDIKDAIEAGEGPCTSGEFLCQLVERLVDRIGDVVDELDEHIDATEEMAGKVNVTELRERLSDMRRQTAHIRRYLAPQRDALDRLHRQPDPVMSEQDNLRVREEADRVQRYLEDLDLIRERGMVAQEEFLSRIAHEQSMRIYVLSVVTVIFMPLTFITGLMGMNVGGIPGARTPLGFALIVGLIAALGVVLVGFFKYRRWL